MHVTPLFINLHWLLIAASYTIQGINVCVQNHHWLCTPLPKVIIQTRDWTTSDFFKLTFMRWKSSRSRLVADDIINEQKVWSCDKRLVHSYEIWDSSAHMTIAPITAYF